MTQNTNKYLGNLNDCITIYPLFQHLLAGGDGLYLFLHLTHLYKYHIGGLQQHCPQLLQLSGRGAAITAQPRHTTAFVQHHRHQSSTMAMQVQVQVQSEKQLTLILHPSWCSWRGMMVGATTTVRGQRTRNRKKKNVTRAGHHSPLFRRELFPFRFSLLKNQINTEN